MSKRIVRKSIVSGRIRCLVVPVTDAALTAWDNGANALEAFADLSFEDRIYVCFGVTPDEYVTTEVINEA